jgi:hypothetical protein
MSNTADQGHAVQFGVLLGVVAAEHAGADDARFEHLGSWPAVYSVRGRGKHWSRT